MCAFGGGARLRFVSNVDPWDPGDPGNRERTRESRSQVRHILMTWDPIGVADTDSEDEYDFMIGPLMHLLDEGANRDALLAFITDQREYMGLSRDREGRDRRLATGLAEWWSTRTAPHNA
jgi:hypothetical protein